MATTSEAAAKREIRVLPAFNKRHPDPRKNYGIGSARLWFSLIGPEAAVTWWVSTGMYLPTVAEELWPRGASAFQPTAGPISLHSPVPLFDGHEPTDCEMLAAGKCYADCAFLAGEDVLTALLRDGDDGVWLILEERYRDLVSRVSSASKAEGKV